MGTDVNIADYGMIGKRQRVAGCLKDGPRGLNIITDAGDLWVLEQDDPVSSLLGRQVIAEGVLSGFDRMRVDWIGAAQS
jgi:Protein of unknown function (DUF5818)